MVSTREKVTGALAWTFLPRIVNTIVALGRSILVVRVLTVHEAGDWKWVEIAIRLIVILCTMGLGQALNRFIPEIRVEGPSSQGRALLYRCLFFQGWCWIGLCVVLLAIRDPLIARYSTIGPLLVIGVALSIAEVTATTMNQYAIASYRTREMAWGLMIGTLVNTAMTALLLSVGLKVQGVLVAMAIGNVVNVLVVGRLLRGSGESQRPMAAGPSKFPLKRLLNYAIPTVPTNLLNFVTWGASEAFIIRFFHPSSLVIFFERAYQLPQMALDFVPSAIYPLVYAAFSETKTLTEKRIPEFISYYYRLLFFVLSPVCLIGFTMGDLLIASLYTGKLAPAGPYCQAFFLIFTISYFGTPLSMAIYVIEKVWVNMALSLGYAVITIALDLWLIPEYGLLGATIPTAVVTAIQPFVRWYFAKKYIPGIKIPWGFITRTLLASAPILILFWIKPWASSAIRVGLVCMLGGVIAIVSYRLFRVLGPEDREFLRNSKLPAKELILKIL